MVSKIIASHARVTKLWTVTQRFWKNPNDDKQKELLQFLNAMTAFLSSCVTDEEWDQALQVAADTLRISPKGETKDGHVKKTATGESDNPSGTAA